MDVEMENKTPRTDAEFKLEAFFDGSGIVETVFVEFARELETELADKDRQLAEARAEIERLKKLQQFAMAINCAMLEADFDPEYLRGHECVAKHKILSMLDLWRKKVKPRLPGFINDEIYRRDKLIEQMRDALKLADDLIDEYAADYEHRDNVDEIREEIKAALAAEGGEG